MTRQDLDNYVDAQVTDKTIVDSLTPTDEGNAIKKVADYTDQQDLLKEDKSNKSTDINTDGASNIKYPSAKAVKDYTDSIVVGLLDDRGGYDASSDLFPSSGGSGTAGAIMKGDLWFISVAGDLGGVSTPVGASVRALSDSPGQTSSNWDILNIGLGYTPENVLNKSTDVTTDGASDIKYPSVKAVKTYVDAHTGGSSVVKVLKTTLTLSQVQNLYTTPITILTQSSGYSRFIQSIYIVRNSTTAYTLNNQNFDITNNSGNVFGYNMNFASLNYTGVAYGYANLSLQGNGVGVLNESIFKLKATGGNPTGGVDGIDVYVTYLEITL